jgi:hypothetical protein
MQNRAGMASLPRSPPLDTLHLRRPLSTHGNRKSEKCENRRLLRRLDYTEAKTRLTVEVLIDGVTSFPRDISPEMIVSMVLIIHYKFL